jgi:SAM-dependent methyltransferase
VAASRRFAQAARSGIIQPEISRWLPPGVDPSIAEPRLTTIRLERRVYDDMLDSLRRAYDRHAAERDRTSVEPWKQDRRQQFLDQLREAGAHTLLEIGAGTGQDGLFFQQHGLGVTCIDLSPEMVSLCRQKGLRAYVRDFLSLGFPAASFDAVYALNCLLHVPNRDLPAVLASIRSILKPGGLFFLGLYAGDGFEGVWNDDTYEPKRFFSFRTDDAIRQAVEAYFGVISFERVTVEHLRNVHAQVFILRAADGAVR